MGAKKRILVLVLLLLVALLYLLPRKQIIILRPPLSSSSSTSSSAQSSLQSSSSSNLASAPAKSSQETVNRKNNRFIQALRKSSSSPSTSSSSSSSSSSSNRKQNPLIPSKHSSSHLKAIPAAPKTPKERIEYLRRFQFFTADGFQYCKTLNNATFDALATLTSTGMTLAELNPSVPEFTQLIDRHAKRIVAEMVSKHPALALKELARFACYCAADGANPLANLSETRLIQWVDPQNYLQPMLPTVQPEPSRIYLQTGTRRKYQIAYLLMVHGDIDVLENIKYLLGELDDGSAIILIHVDAGSQELHDVVSAYVTERETQMNEMNYPHSVPVPGNVFMAKRRYRGAWGYVSLVWIEISGFWELMDLAEWHHVINLSAQDIPLRR
ncbi:hypothetical protein HDU97_008019, partial [Phlyctochytrium planicorne]